MMVPSSLFHFPSTLTKNVRMRTLLNRILPIVLVLIVCFWTEQVVAQEQEQDQDDKNTTTSLSGSGEIIKTPEYSVPADAILYPWVMQLLGCFSLFILTRFNIPIPYAAIMFIWGALFGFIPSLTKETHDDDSPFRNYLRNSIISWIDIDSASLLLIFLPGLIFKEAVEIPINLFQVAIVQIWILSFPMVLVGTGITAAAVKYCLPYDGESPEIYTWVAWCTLGAILSATDPIAVSSVLKTAGASPRLVMHISGESLLNDGSSYVFFTIASHLWYQTLGCPDDKTADYKTLDWVGFFFRMSVGGSLMGAVFGFGLLGILWELDRRMEKDFDIVQVVMGLTAAYLCYFVCDQMLDTSGVMAAVALGIVVNRFGKGMINDEGLMHSYLALADFLLNTLLFTLGGTIWAAASFFDKSSRYTVNFKDFGWLLVFYVLCSVIRFIQIGMFYPVLSRIGLKSNWREGIFLAWGGLHGSVGIALGLSLLQYVFEHTDINDIEKRKAATIIQFLGGGATLLTLTINGTSAGFILKQLGLVKPKVSADHIKHLYEGTAKDFIYHQIANLLQEPRFQDINFAVLKEFVPFVTKEPPRLSCNRHSKANGKSVQEFTQRVAGEGQHYINLLNATKRASIHATATIQNEHYKKELLVEMRQIFLELLREAYKVKVELGELDPKSHNGVLRDVLMQSVDLALNDVRYDDMPIDDWKHTEIFFRWDRMTRDHSGSIRESIRRSSNVKRELRNRRTSRRVSLGSNETTDHHAKRVSNISFTSSLLSIVGSERSSPLEHHVEKIKLNGKRVRVDVLRAISFKHGHKMAEEKLKLYVNRFDDEENESMRDRHTLTETVLAQVLTESHEQVKFADSMLAKEVDDRELNIILSHYCATILVRRLHMFTEQKAHEDLIGKQEARLYLDGTKHKIHEIEQKTVERLANYEHGQCAELESDLENIHEDDSIENKSRLMRLLKSDASVDDPQNGDTIGASNTKSSRNLPSFSTPLPALFDPPPGFSVSSMPQINEDEDEDDKKNEKKKDGGDEAQVDENLEKKESEEEEEDDDDDAQDDESRSSYASA